MAFIKLISAARISAIATKIITASTGGAHYFNDQSYYLEASKAGQHYFNFNWDQTPHLYSIAH